MRLYPAVIFCFFFFGIFIKGAVAEIETQQTVWAAVGDEASLRCQLSKDEDVLQITWQRVLPDGEKNLATYTEKFGSRVSLELQEKMDFQHKSLQSCSMVIRKVTQQDAGCYRCLFNTYPRGALIGRTCISLYELDEAVLGVRRSDSPAESVVSCSATGRPAPTVTLTVLQQNLTFSHLNSSRVTNTNGTVTVTTTALLSASSSTQVGCSVSVFSAAARELLLTVPGAAETDGDGSDELSSSRSYGKQESEDLNSTLIPVVAAAVVVVACFGAALAIITHWRYKKDKNRDDENKTPVRPAPMERIKTPLMRLTNETRLRSSTKKSPENNNLKGSPSVQKNLLDDFNRTDG